MKITMKEDRGKREIKTKKSYLILEYDLYFLELRNKSIGNKSIRKNILP